MSVLLVICFYQICESVHQLEIIKPNLLLHKQQVSTHINLSSEKNNGAECQ